MVRDGIPYVAIPLVLAILPVIFGYWLLAIPFVAIAAFMAYFFRDPHRIIPTEPGIIVAPADGLITIVRLANGPDHLHSLLTIFLSILIRDRNNTPLNPT